MNERYGEMTEEEIREEFYATIMEHREWMEAWIEEQKQKEQDYIDYIKREEK